MGVAYEPSLPLLPIRTRRVAQLLVIVLVAIAGVAFWRGAQPPMLEEQYRTLVGANELIGNSELLFDRMSSPQSLADAEDLGHANIYGHFDGPNERHLVVYQVHESADAARSAFADQRAQASDYRKFYETPFYEPGDYHVITPGHAQWGTRLDNVVMLGEVWRNAPEDVDAILDQRAQSMLMIAMKNYLRLLGTDGEPRVSERALRRVKQTFQPPPRKPSDGRA